MALIHPDDLKDSTVRGQDHGASISLIIDESEPGQGPRLHRHAYDETWVIQEGSISFQVGDNCLKAGPGDIAIIPPGVPHKFTNDGPGRSKSSASTPAQRSSANGLNNRCLPMVIADNDRRLLEVNRAARLLSRRSTA